MSGFEFQRDTVAKGSALRRVLLFCVIGVLTCGGLWLLAPSGGQTGKTTPVAAEKSAGKGADQKDPEALLPGDGTPNGNASGDRQLPVAEGEKPAAGDGAADETAKDSGEETASEQAPEGAEKADGKSAAGATAIPEKDKPWIGDVPAAEDAPRVPPDKPDAASAGVGSAGTPEPYSASWRAQAGTLTRGNWKLVSGKEPSNAEMVTHTVVSGDSLSKLAVKYHCAADVIQLSNGLKSDRIRVGMKLKVLPGPWLVEVNKSARMLSVFRMHGGKKQLFLAFDVGIGRLGKTPAADFVICARLRHPVWYAPDGSVFPYGDAGNPLGDYFLKLAVSGKNGRPLRGFGIHGTRDEAGVTRSRSNGCIRMRNRDVERLYQLLPVGTPVRIVE